MEILQLNISTLLWSVFFKRHGDKCVIKIRKIFNLQTASTQSRISARDRRAGEMHAPRETVRACVFGRQPREPRIEVKLSCTRVFPLANYCGFAKMGDTRRWHIQIQKLFILIQNGHGFRSGDCRNNVPSLLPLFSLYTSIVISIVISQQLKVCSNDFTNVQVLCVNVENLIACMRCYLGEISCPVVLAQIHFLGHNLTLLYPNYRSLFSNQVFYFSWFVFNMYISKFSTRRRESWQYISVLYSLRQVHKFFSLIQCFRVKIDGESAGLSILALTQHNCWLTLGLELYSLSQRFVIIILE